MIAGEFVGLATWVSGVLVGAGAVAVGWWRWSGSAHDRSACPDPEAHALDEDDQFAVSAQFAGHVVAVHQQLSDYADHLADGDEVLRERLRRIEGVGR